jgi:type I restriction enzyme S subunit
MILPSRWKWSTLAESCEIILGQSPPSDTYNTERDGLPFFQGKAEFGKIFPTPLKWCSKPNKIARAGDVLISVRAPVGPVNLCFEESCIGRGLAAIRPNGDMPIRYFFYYLQYIEGEWDEKATGTTFKAITGNILRRQAIPLAPIAEQERIVERIESLFTQLDAGVAGLKRVQAALKRYRLSVLKAACEGRLVVGGIRNEYRKLPDTWKSISLGDLACQVTSGSRGWAKYYTDEGDLFLRVGNFNKLTTTIDLSNVAKVNAPDTVEGNRTRLQMGDVLVTITADVGMVGIVDDRIMKLWKRSYINQHVGLIRLANPQFSPYIAYALASDMLQTQFKNKQYGATKKGLNLDDLKSLIIPLPPLEEQRYIVAEVERRLSVVQELEQAVSVSLKRTARLRKAVLKAAFEGRL